MQNAIGIYSTPTVVWESTHFFPTKNFGASQRSFSLKPYLEWTGFSLNGGVYKRSKARKLAPGIATSCLTIISRNSDNVTGGSGGPSRWTAGFELAKYDNSVPRLVHVAGCGTWAMLFSNLTTGDIAHARALGLAVIPWTVNDPLEIARLIDLKVDGIITDYPDRLRKVMAAKGMPLP